MKWNGIDPRLHRPKFPGVSPHSSVFPGAVAQGAELGGGTMAAGTSVPTVTLGSLGTIR